MTVAFAFVAVASPITGVADPVQAAPVPTATGSQSLAAVMPSTDCAALARLDVTRIAGPGSRVVSASEGAGAQPGRVCVVEGVLAPTIGFRVELPTTTWTQRYLQTGCGGLCGDVRINIGAADRCPTVDQSGFVVATTDMGHSGRGNDWAGNSQKVADFAYRGVHLTALAAKALIRAYYGRSERYSYFSGCSDGGREALIEAQRFPGDFDGIVAGAPAMNFTVQNSLYHGWQARSNTGPDGRAILVADRLRLVHSAVLAACDALDGQKDGLVSTPGRCRFDPASIVCRAGEDAKGCLSPSEAMVVRAFYDGPRDPRTGVRLTQGGPLFGSELQWAGVYVPVTADQPIFSAMIVRDAAHLIFPGNPSGSERTLEFDQATFDRSGERHALLDATNPDLSRFAARGGRLILFHGLADPHISPLNTIAYHDAIRRTMGARAEAFERLYLMPGMGHCSGGEGPSKFDLLGAVMSWVEGGSAPSAILTRTPQPDERSPFGMPGGRAAPGPAGSNIARPQSLGTAAPTRQMGPPPGMMPPAQPVVQRSRPVYPYPYVAEFSGKGNPDLATGWIRGAAVPIDVPSWAGSKYYRPYAGTTG